MAVKWRVESGEWRVGIIRRWSKSPDLDLSGGNLQIAVEGV